MQAINLHPFISHKIRTSLWSIVYVSATLTGIALLGITLNMLFHG